jgi:16S rRNA (uracil1498-N3)-methyltransferase
VTSANSRGRARDALFYCAALEDAGDVVLGGDEVDHVKAQRLQPGDSLMLFDGRGQVARGTVRSIVRREIRIAIGERRRESPPRPRIELYCAVPKGDRVAVLLDMATQLGMSRFTPVRWTRAVVEPGARAAGRWQRVCLEACKQSRRLHLPEIGAPVTLADAIAKARAGGARLLLAHPGSRTALASPPDFASAPRVALFAGPEGGLVDDELTLLRDAGADFLSLGEGILRIETAAIALLAAVNVLGTFENK